MWEKKTLGPGPTKLVGGNLQAGFYGEVSTSDLITGDELARIIGLTAGDSRMDNDPWLKFSYLGNVEYVAKTTFRYSISWNDINAVNAVYGNRTIKIGNHNYKIRLLKRKNEGNLYNTSFDYGSICHNSEWNRLMLPIHANAPSNWKSPRNVKSPTENWNIGYDDDDLCTGGRTRRGFCSWCQEYGSYSGSRMLGGEEEMDASAAGSYDSDTDLEAYGWRPVLELID